jgi:hypothetical protein
MKTEENLVLISISTAAALAGLAGGIFRGLQVQGINAEDAAAIVAVQLLAQTSQWASMKHRGNPDAHRRVCDAAMIEMAAKMRQLFPELAPFIGTAVEVTKIQTK